LLLCLTQEVKELEKEGNTEYAAKVLEVTLQYNFPLLASMSGLTCPTTFENSPNSPRILMHWV
jgi:hypothetical protein